MFVPAACPRRPRSAVNKPGEGRRVRAVGSKPNCGPARISRWNMGTGREPVWTHALTIMGAVTEHGEEPATDEALAVKARNGDQDAFAELVRRYQQGVVNLAYRLVGSREEALDLSQEIFLRVYENLDRFDPRRPFKPWLYRIATNYCYDFLRRQGRRRESVEEVSFAAGEALADKHVNPEAAVLRGEVQRVVEEVIASLPARYRPAVILRYVEGMSYQEIAEALQLPLGTVKTYLHRSRELLRTALEERGIRP